MFQSCTYHTKLLNYAMQWCFDDTRLHGIVAPCVIQRCSSETQSPSAPPNLMKISVHFDGLFDDGETFEERGVMTVGQREQILVDVRERVKNFQNFGASHYLFAELGSGTEENRYCCREM